MGVAPWHLAGEGVSYIHSFGTGHTAGGNQGIKHGIAEVALTRRVYIETTCMHTIRKNLPAAHWVPNRSD